MINVEKELERIQRERREGIRPHDQHDYMLLYVSMFSGLIGFAAGLLVAFVMIVAFDRL